MRVFIISILFVLIIFNSCCNQDRPALAAIIKIQFDGIQDSDLAHVWIIEKDRYDSSIIIDSIFYGNLTSTRNFTIDLFLDLYRTNGDYYIHADSITNVNKITNVEVLTKEDRCGPKSVTFSYDFNGISKTEEDHKIIISNNIAKR